MSITSRCRTKCASIGYVYGFSKGGTAYCSRYGVERKYGVLDVEVYLRIATLPSWRDGVVMIDPAHEQAQAG